MAARRPALLPKVTSFGDLLAKASLDPRYAQLALVAARNLGWHHPAAAAADTRAHFNLLLVTSAINWLKLNALATSDRGVIKEINFVRDLVTETAVTF